MSADPVQEKAPNEVVERLRAVLDGYTGTYEKLAGAGSYGDYITAKRDQEDEEILTERVMHDIAIEVLGFPKDALLPQFSRGGLKPDLTPMDLIAHPFVLDAKSSTQDLAAHEAQIRKYVDQRQLDYGILFNLAEFRVFRRGAKGHDEGLSFPVRPLWEAATGGAIPVAEELERFAEFVATFRHHEMSLAERVERIREAKPWAEREQAGDVAEIDVDHLVEQLRDLSRELTEDAAAQVDDLRATLRLNPERERPILGELAALAQDLEPGVTEVALPASIEGYLGVSSGLAARIWHQYLVRVAQLTIARIVLYRAWEDVGFVDDCLFDGGFAEAYDRLDGSARRVLQHAFAEGSQRYPWLFGADNNYAWYRPREQALVDVLYGLIPFPLGRLNADVLGGLYESYVDEIDRDRLGQFYTPRSVVRFMIERAGFEGPEKVFTLEGDQRKPRRVLDFASGSGGFVVEAARRIIDSVGLDSDDADDLLDGLTAIAQGVHCCEISPFPYYLTEINLLLQVSRLLGSLGLAQRDPPSFVLSAVHADTLTTRAAGGQSLEGLRADERADEAVLTQDEHFGLVPLDAKKQAAFDRMREDGAFDLVVGNPPYVFESNNRLLFERLRKIPGWSEIYRGKSDYLYYFLYLAVEKLRPGGRLCVITPAGWMNAGNADWLREFVAASLRLDELYLFGSYRLFAPEREARARRHRAPTPTVESAILVATKAKPRKDHRLRVVVLENEAEAAAKLDSDPDARSPDRDSLLEAMGKRARGKAGRRDGIHVHDIGQSELVHDRPWPIKHASEDVPRRVVAQLESVPASDSVPIERLGTRWAIARGIETAADAFSPRIRRRLARSFPAVLKGLEARGADLGDPIMELPPGLERQSPWVDHPEVLARNIEPEAILYSAMDETNYSSLVWLGADDHPPPAVLRALEPWRDLLANRAGNLEQPGRPWWVTHRVRDREMLRRPKVIALYRTNRGRFSLDGSGKWQPSGKTTLVIPESEDLSVAYCCGLLNSELLDLWYAVRGKIPRDVWRNYEPKPMAEIPYRHVDLSQRPSAESLDRLTAAIAGGAVEEACDVALAIAERLRDEPEADREAAVALEELVRAIGENRRRLLPHRDRFPELGRVVKDPWSIGPVTADALAFLGRLGKAETVSARLDPEMTVTIEGDGVLGRPSRAGGVLVLTYRKRETARVTGPADKLDLLETILDSTSKVTATELRRAPLPKDMDAFHATIAADSALVDGLLGEGRTLVEAAERLVCALYGVPPELEDDVVEHALARVGLATDGTA